MKELIEDIGVDAARYFFIMRSIDSPLDFDLDLAKRESSGVFSVFVNPHGEYGAEDILLHEP